MYFDAHTHSSLIIPNTVSVFNAGMASASAGFFSSGIHPFDENLFRFSKQELASIAIAATNCLAIGETGLDKNSPVSMRLQQQVFEEHLEVAESLKLPVILHCVKSWNEMRGIRRKMTLSHSWIFHGFRKTGLLDSVLQEEVMISIGAAVCYDTKLRQAIPAIPDHLLLLETDDSDRYSINDIYEQTAALRGISGQELKQQIEKNFRTAFSRYKTVPSL